VHQAAAQVAVAAAIVHQAAVQVVAALVRQAAVRGVVQAAVGAALHVDKFFGYTGGFFTAFFKF
jgi:hypothetical protein